MIVAAILGTALAGALALIAWLAHGRVAAADDEADARVDEVTTEAELERAQFQLEAATKALAASRRREAILQEAVADAIAADSHPDLARNDVLGRVLRIAGEWARADAAGRVPASAGELVPDAGAAGEADAAVQAEGA